MSPKRLDPVAPPRVGDEWEIRYGTTEAAAGWPELAKKAAGNARRAWELMRTRPGQAPDERHHQLKGALASGTHGGRVLPRWQIEVTGGGRIWYLLDVKYHTVWVQYASLRHPKSTDSP